MVELAAVVATGVVLAAAVAVFSTPVPLTHRTVFAAAPWTVAAAAVVVGRRGGLHDGLGVSTPAVLGAVVLAALGIWILFSHLATLRGLPYSERYLVASGVGAAAVVSTALAGTVGGIEPTRAVWLAFVPVLAGVLAAPAYFLLGLVYTEALVTFRVAGLYVLWTVVLEAVASAVATSVLGAADPGLVSAAVSFALGVDPSPWLGPPLQALLGAAVVGCCGWLARLYGPAGYGFALGVSTLSLGSGTVVLLSATLLG